MKDIIDRLTVPHGCERLQAAALTRGILEFSDATGLPLDQSRAIVLATLDQELAAIAESAPVIAGQILALTSRVEDEALDMARKVVELARRAADSDPS